MSYDAVAADYDRMHPQHPHLLERQRAEILEAYTWLAYEQPISEIRVVELCAGTGLLTVELLKAGPVGVAAVEPSEQMAGALGSRVIKAGAIERCMVFDGTIEQFIAIKPGQFDMLAIKQGFGILPGSLIKLVAEMSVLLKPRSVFYVAEEFIMEPRMAPAFYRWYKLLTELDELLRPDVVEYYQTLPDRAGLEYAERVSEVMLKKALEMAGFRRQRVNEFAVRSNETLSLLASTFGGVNAFSIVAFREP